MWHALLLISFLVFWFLAQLVALWKDIIFFFFLFYLYRCGSFSLWSLLLLLLPLSVSVHVNILHEGRDWHKWITDNSNNTAGQGIGKGVCYNRCWNTAISPHSLMRGMFHGKGVSSSMTEMPYWWHKICPESGQELSLVKVLFLFFLLLFTNYRQNTKDHKGQM